MSAFQLPTEWDADRPWLPQPCDTAETYHWFLLYSTALAAPRDVTQLQRMGCRIPVPKLLQLEETQAWQLRAECYDRHLAEIRLQTIERETETLAQAAARRMQAARSLTMLGAAEVERLAKRASLTPEHPGSIDPALAVRAVVQGIKAEHLVSGMPTARIEEVDDRALDALSVDELRTMRDLQAKVERRRQTG